MALVKRKVYLDMDGTIADLYGSKGWQYKLDNHKCGAFENLHALITEYELFSMFPEEDYQITILSMTPKDAPKWYQEQSIKEKNVWLDKHFPKLQKRIYVEYGHDKNLRGSKKAILIDDNETIRNAWKGIALDPVELWG